MNHKLYTIAFFCIFLLFAGNSRAQCPNGRYTTTLFSSVKVDSVTYSARYSLKMNIYTPVGDSLAQRPLIILAHGGSFVSGNRASDSTVVRLCRNFAKRGYVTASIDYRLGQAVNLISPDSTYILDELAKSMSDGKAAMRYFVRDSFALANYRVDSANMYVGGNGAGSVAYMHIAYLDSMAEAPRYLQTAIDSNGGFDGNSGFGSATPRPKAVINLAGALNQSSFIGRGDVPSVNAHGDADLVVPFYCGKPNIGVPYNIQLCGLGALEPAYNAARVYHWSRVFAGDSHEPWTTDDTKFFTVDSMVTQFLYTLVCHDTVLSVNTASIAAQTDVFPNPASGSINVHSSTPISALMLVDNMGRVLKQVAANSATHYVFDLSGIPTGMYLLKINYEGNAAPEVKKVVVE